MNRMMTTLTRFTANRSGATAVEFAMIVPVLLVLYIGAVEVGQGLAADRKLEALTNTVGDLMARLSGDVPRATVQDFFDAATPIMLPFDPATVSQRITVAQVDASGNARVRDSVGHNGATPLGENAPLVLPPEVATLATSNWVVVSEAWYEYSPAMGFVVGGNIDLSKRQYFVPRSTGGINIVN